MTRAAYDLVPVAQAAIADLAGIPVNDNATIMEFTDENSDDYPNLRRELTKAKASYDFYSQKKGDGDHTRWLHGRKGEKETFSNFGNSDTPI